MNKVNTDSRQEKEMKYFFSIGEKGLCVFVVYLCWVHQK